MKTKIEINSILYYYLVFVISAYLTDILNLVFKIFQLGSTIPNPWLIIIFFIPTCIILRKYISSTGIKHPYIMTVISLIVLGLSMFKIPLPDQSFDTLNYHLYLQNHRFVDNINDNFFPNGVQSFFFFLSDNMYYVFRYFFGYRLGTIFNTWILVMIIYQVVEICLIFLERTKNKLSSLLLLFGIFTIFSIYILANIGIYYVDLFALPIILWMLQEAIFKSKMPISQILLMVILTGLTICLKTTFGLFSLPILLFIIYQNRHKISIVKSFIILLIALAICLPYLLFNYYYTHNPVFPLFNDIFQSPYFENYNLTNANSPKDFFEKIFWPFIILFSPEKLLLQANSGRLIFGYVLSVSIIFAHYSKIYKVNRYLKLFALFFMVMYFIWVFGTGYLRYGLILEVLSGIIVFLAVLETMRFNFVSKSLGVVIILLFIFQSLVSLKYFIYENKEWSWRPPAITNQANYFENLKYIMHDYSLPKIPSEIQTADLIGIVSYNSGQSSLFNIKKPLISFTYNSPETKYFSEQKINYINQFRDKKIIILDDCMAQEEIINSVQPFNFLIANQTKYFDQVLNKEQCIYSLNSM